MRVRVFIPLLALGLIVGSCSYEPSGTTTTTTIIEADVPPATGPADIVVGDQRIEGSGIMVESVSMPAEGFIVLQADDGGLPGETIGVSELLGDGTTANVQVPFFLPTADDMVVHVTLHIDMDRDGRFTYEPPDAFVDIPATFANDRVATTTATIVQLPPLWPGGIILEEQRGEGQSVTVAAVTLPAQGFVAFREDDDGSPGRIIALSGVLPAGETIDLVIPLDPPITETGPYWVVAFIDRNEDGGLAVTGAPGADEVALTNDGQEVAVSVLITVISRGPSQVVASDQLTDGTVIEVESVTLASPGWLEIRADDGGSPGARLAVTDLLPEGVSGPLFMTLDAALEAETILWFRLRVDLDGNGEIGSEDPFAEDADGNPILESIDVTLPEPDDGEDGADT
ncbi:hypothetical protein HQ535_12900 [bacterium]|nr:hypothetical protein [bacterium]